MKKLKKNLMIVSAGILLVAFSAYLRDLISRPPSKAKNNSEKAIALAGRYLQKQLTGSGKFIYWVDLNEERKLKPKYNILRHMGSLYSLKMLEDYKEGSINKDKVRKSLLWVKENTFAPLENNTLGVWSSEEISGRKGMPTQVKLGAAGLVLVGMCGFYDLIKEELPLSELERIGDFIIFMQRPDGGFTSKYKKKGGKDNSWVSLYYPGEAAFGLVELFKLSGKEKYLESAIRAMDFLYESRKELEASQVPADHWALIATDKILTSGHAIKPEVRDRLLKHGNKVVKSILLSRVTSHELDVAIGGFHEWAKTTPTATRVEGLNAFYPHISDKRLKTFVKDAIDGAVEFLLKAQILEGAYAGAWTRSIIKLDGPGRDVKNHNRRRHEIRIDYVQHAMSALIEAQKLK